MEGKKEEERHREGGKKSKALEIFIKTGFLFEAPNEDEETGKILTFVCKPP